MIFVDQGERIPRNPGLPNRLIVVTLLEFLGYFLVGLFIGTVFGPVFKILISSN